jgi:glycerol dehydrogenase
VPDPFFSPHDHFAPLSEGAPRLRVFASPGRYLQGPGVLDRLGHHLISLGAKHVALLMSDRRRSSEGPRILAGLTDAGIVGSVVRFEGECTLNAIAAHVAAILSFAAPVDGLIAVGGGKAIDTGRSVAYRLGVPLVVVPTLASNDAPCSAVSVLYTADGVDAGAEFFPQSPALTVVDSGVIVAAGERYLVAGMGDAIATAYEARAVAANPHATTVIGGRPTVAGLALAEACATTLFTYGVDAARACAEGRVDDPLERVIEANTLLSGLGFESGGLAAAHAVAQGCTAVPSLRAHYLHGELVALGALVQLMLEGNAQEARRVATFCVDVGLPVHLEQFGLTPESRSDIDAIVAAALAFPTLANMPVEVTAAMLHRALLDAHRLGEEVSAEFGDRAYRRLHTG